MAKVRASSLLVLAMVLVAMIGGAAARKNEITDAGYLDIKDTPCWSCHVTWSPPLREIATMVLPTGLEAGLGEEFDYTIRVEPTWRPDPDPEFVRFEPSLDISDAPSLTFADSPAPELAKVLRGVIATTGGFPTTGQRGHVVVDVPAGVSDVVLTLQPNNTDPRFGPDLILNIYPTKDSPAGIPIQVDEAGPGAPETFRVTKELVAEHGTGPWTVEAETKPVTAAPSPNIAGDIDFQVVVDKYYNATGGVQFKSLSYDFGSGVTGKSTLFTWRLRVLDTPLPGERMEARLNLTSYYQHTDGSYEDIAYTYHNFSVPVAATGGGGANFEAKTVVVSTEATGVTLNRISEVIGYVSAILVLASLYTGGMFGKTSRRQLNKVFYSAKRRVAFHNFLSYAIIATAIVHAIIFLWHWPNIEGNYHWSLGLIWGGAAILAMFGLGVTGALQVPMIRKWNYAVWRWSHFGLTIAVIVLTIVHILLDGGNFGNVQETLGWKNPLDTR